MKITKIKIDSLYGIKHLELDGKPIEIRGAKGVGKTSVLDSIKYALTNRSDRDYIVKCGESEGAIVIETDTGISINRKKRVEGSDYTKITEYGKQVASPQSFINEIFTPLQLNPVEFATWTKSEQNRAILDLIEFDWDINWIKEQFGEIPIGVDYNQHILQVLEDIQAKNGDYWVRREDVNRKELYKRQEMADVAQRIPQNYKLDKWESYNLSDKIKQLQTIQENNNVIERAKTFYESYSNKVRGFEAEKEIAISAEEQSISTERISLTSTIERLKVEIRTAEEKLLTLNDKLEDKKAIIIANFNQKIGKLDNDVKTAIEYKDKEKIDVTQLQEEINEASKMKEYISEYKSFINKKEECVRLKTESERLTSKIKLARELPGKVLESATIPIAGLSVENGIPLINGLPVSNLSSGERIELCVDITLAKRNNLQLILLDGIESLDGQSREKLYQKCKEKGLQIIAARTTNDSEFTVVEL